MGGALIHGFYAEGQTDLLACDIDPAVLEPFEQLGIETSTDPTKAEAADIVFVAVKPGLVRTVVSDLDLREEQTLISIAAGVETAHIDSITDATVVRVMPNLAAKWGLMAAAISGEEITETVRSTLELIGEVVEIDESAMDTATALNGSGPAFVFYFIQAMAAVGVQGGIAAPKARILAAQTFKGAAETVLQADDSLEELIDAVCSPKGTTIEGMGVLEDRSVEADIAAAVEAAEKRATELAAEAANE